MTVIALDDTDSRERGMCSTYLATRLAETLVDAGSDVERRLLVRLNPAIEHKTRGNAAVALHTSCAPSAAFDHACRAVERWSEFEDDRTSPGVVVAPGDPSAVPEPIARFARDAVRERHSLDAALSLAEEHGYDHRGWDGGRGRIGALAAVGAWAGMDEWTYEHISYRAFERCGTPREVDAETVFAAADWGYPTVWDTVDRVEGEPVCVPNAPGPILYGVRGDDPVRCREVAERIESEPVDRRATFVTNQGTDAHLHDDDFGSLRDGRASRVSGVVTSAPETRRGGHVFFGFGPSSETDVDDEGGVDCVAFEPTKRFRDRVRSLRRGDRLTVCGEVSAGTLKLEKFAVRSLVRVERATPTCPDCGRTMKSAGADQGYRCRDCKTRSESVVEEVDRILEPGWYEVPPCARRHVAKPLVRGGFDAPTHPER
ncbi:tRNA(Ile2) 2-agmatinylcytidine synthetase [Salinigranum rubrum]|uniref:tRNA(Ile2) 2-agmatinylcytidine synthetase TiaS n=1 Tax=Salinigranum rubrum TaxID=755307 RepID=A0A2I8VEX5_9EURY|nr:tRNA(Ile)(2)-agmatinylcytidine synthase [Salinigranum rubrum]AUV80478.1 tRNA(Ile2) 2-agmatinylcytidine synthetase [Salinigranum rubrum]